MVFGKQIPMYLVLVVSESLWTYSYWLVFSFAFSKFCFLMHICYWLWETEHHGQIGCLLGEMYKTTLVYYYPQIRYQCLYLIYFVFLLQNVLYATDYIVLIVRTVGFFGYFQWYVLCWCLHKLKINFWFIQKFQSIIQSFNKSIKISSGGSV